MVQLVFTPVAGNENFVSVWNHEIAPFETKASEKIFTFYLNHVTGIAERQFRAFCTGT